MGAGTNDFYPRPPRGERRETDHPGQTIAQISIHALREESDLALFFAAGVVFVISIHALREESDDSVGQL